ncbi:unnamed protein product [Phytomonas sp. EM1]|nr:unnamed protein product [Phytomonas sp. EM1]|eukprot:CCW65874.1 unnamed protein product [Phytomonas sp. isolate EM1]
MSATTTRVDLGNPTTPPTLSVPSEAAVDNKAREESCVQCASPYATYVSIDYMQRLWLLRSVSRTLLAPLDRIKFVMQTQKELIRHGTLAREFYSTWECVRYLSVVEGKRSFWRGNLIQVVAILPIALAQLFIAAPIEGLIFESFPMHSALSCTVASYASMLGGALALCLISYPLDFARFRLAVDIKTCRESPYAFKHSLAFFSQPVLSEFTPYLYRGLTLYVSGSFVYKAVYNVLINLVLPYMPPDRDASWWPILVQTATSITVAGVATLCLHPIDLVRHRLMIAVTSDRLRYPSAMSCVRRIAQKEGLRGFYRGGTITLVRFMAAMGLVFAKLPL